MAASTERWPGRVALIVGHCAGMVDLVALPVWINDLIGNYKFDPQQAGLLVTLFLLGVLFCSLVVAPNFTRINTRLFAVVGFGVSALAFLGAAFTRDSFPLPPCTPWEASARAAASASSTARSDAAPIRIACSPTQTLRSAFSPWCFSA
jgi:hypothetical protein